ncbi:MAG: hypothetical protein N3C61_00505 [Candidatus Micrarchaeota archaeon]|nr:hypothetical protein [Candidatus Micrarchaeota archaeon]
MEALLNPGQQQTGVNKQIVYLNKIIQLSEEDLRKLDALDGKIDGKISLELFAGSRKIKINLEYNDKGIYLVMKDGNKVKLGEGDIIAVNFDNNRVTVIKPTKNMSIAEKVHELMKGSGWHAYIVGNGRLSLYYASLNQEFAITHSNKYEIATLNGNKITPGIPGIKRNEIPGYTDYRRSEWDSQNNSTRNQNQNNQKGSKILEALERLKGSVPNPNLLANIYEGYDKYVSIDEYVELAKRHFESSKDFLKSLSNFLKELEDLKKRRETPNQEKTVTTSNYDEAGLGLSGTTTDQSNQIPNSPYGSGLRFGHQQPLSESSNSQQPNSGQQNQTPTKSPRGSSSRQNQTQPFTQEQSYQEYRKGERESYEYLTRNPEALENISDSQKPPENQTNNQQNQTQQPNSGQRNNQTPLTQQLNSAQNQSITSEVVNLMVELERMEIGSGNIMLLTSAYNGLKRRYGDKINAQTYLEIVEKHWNPQRNFVDFYRSVLKEIHERFRDTTVEYNKPTTSSTTHSEESKSFTVSNPLNDETESFNKDELATTNNSVLYLRIGESGRIEVEGREVNFTVGRDLNGVYVDIRLPDEQEKTHRMYILMKPQPNVEELQETPFGIIVDPVTGELKFEPILPDTKGKRYLIVANLKDDKRIAISLEKINL